MMLIFQNAAGFSFAYNLALSNELYFQPTKRSNLRISRNRISPHRSYSINVIDVKIVSTENDLG